MGEREEPVVLPDSGVTEENALERCEGTLGKSWNILSRSSFLDLTIP